jgi:hypothetical protein
MRATGVVAALLLALAASAGAQVRNPAAARKPATPAGGRPVPAVEVRTWVSRTAVWVGDKFVYVVELRRAPNVEVFLDDLAPEKLRLEGLEVLETATERDASGANLVVDRVRFTLATYNVEAATLAVGAIPVRFSVRRTGQKAEEALPAGEVIVPALHVDLRSTITASGDAVEIRDQGAVRPVPRRVRFAERAGWTLLALAALPVLVGAGRLVRRARRARPRRPTRPPLKQRRAALEEIRDADVSTPAARQDAYAALDAWIRDNVHLAGGVPPAALTPEEIAGALGDSRPAGWREELERILLECERAKYGVDLPPADRWPAVVDAAATLTLARPLS